MTSAGFVPRPDSLRAASNASSRALSPARRSSRSPSPRMPSPRNSPAMRPQSPLANRLDAARYESLQPPSSRRTMASNSQRRANMQSLKLPALPRFHPANYPSSNHSSTDNTPNVDSALGSPQPPMSPRAHQRVYSDAQKHLLAYQHEMISAAVRASSPGGLDHPLSPRLVPLGSPGPVTPLELEAEEGYLVAGATHNRSGNLTVASDALVEELIRQESKRRLHHRTSEKSTSHNSR